MKNRKCRFCGIDFLGKKQSNPAKAQCKECRKVWSHLRNKRSEMEDGFTVRDLVLWWINQKQECHYCKSTKRLTIDRIVPAYKGGKYGYGNIQILCYKCNCCIKIDSDSVEDALKDVTEKTCNVCKKTYPLTEKFWHKNAYKSKYKRTASEYHPCCKTCRLEKERKHPFVCLNCSKKALGYKKFTSFCCGGCARKYYGKKNLVKRECLFCHTSMVMSKFSNKKYCSNKCSSLNMVRNVDGIFVKTRAN